MNRITFIQVGTIKRFKNIKTKCEILHIKIIIIIMSSGFTNLFLTMYIEIVVTYEIDESRHYDVYFQDLSQQFKYCNSPPLSRRYVITQQSALIELKFRCNCIFQMYLNVTILLHSNEHCVMKIFSNYSCMSVILSSNY